MPPAMGPWTLRPYAYGNRCRTNQRIECSDHRIHDFADAISQCLPCVLILSHRTFIMSTEDSVSTPAPFFASQARGNAAI